MQTALREKPKPTSAKKLFITSKLLPLQVVIMHELYVLLDVNFQIVNVLLPLILSNSASL